MILLMQYKVLKEKEENPAISNSCQKKCKKNGNENNSRTKKQLREKAMG